MTDIDNKISNSHKIYDACVALINVYAHVYVKCKNYFTFRVSKRGFKYILGRKSTNVCIQMRFASLLITCGDHRVSASFRTSWLRVARFADVLFFSLPLLVLSSFISGGTSGMLSYTSD